MKKLITITLFTLFFFLSVFSVPAKAEIIAGSSAPLTHQSFIADKDIERDIEVVKEKQLKVVIESVLNRYSSPLASESDSFVKACIKYEIDCYLLPSIAGLESTFGKFIYPNSHNPFGWGGGLIMFDKWSDSIDAVAKGLKNNYYDKGANTVDSIAPIYSESPTWAVRVNFFVNQFQKEEEKLSLLSNQFPVQL